MTVLVVIDTVGDAAVDDDNAAAKVGEVDGAEDRSCVSAALSQVLLSCAQRGRIGRDWTDTQPTRSDSVNHSFVYPMLN